MIIPTRRIESNAPYGVITGVDEVGRGCLAGPVVAAAVILDEQIDIPLLRDSKKLSKRQRSIVEIQIKQQARYIGIGWVSAVEVDEQGLSWAVKQSGLRALQDLWIKPEFVILDGKHNYLKDSEYKSAAYVGADATESCVAAASIIAKCARDNYMELLANAYPAYGFESHVGYGTIKHKLALKELGPSPYHRQSFAGVLQ